MTLKIADRILGEDNPVFIVAELSGNHLQNVTVAKKSIMAIKEAGADSVKLQTYTPDTMTINSDKKHFKIKQGSLWGVT